MREVKDKLNKYWLDETDRTIKLAGNRRRGTGWEQESNTLGSNGSNERRKQERLKYLQTNIHKHSSF